jgi:hypothetical protein
VRKTLFFTAGIAIIYSRRYWLLILLFPIATLNRETTIFLVPLLLLDACCDGGRLRSKNLLRPSLLGLAATLAFLWAAVLIYVHHRFRANPTDLGFYFMLNVRQILTPEHWPQLLSIGGFLPFFLWWSVRSIADFRLRLYLCIFPVWFVVMSVYGSLLETRVFGELSGLLALTCALAFEEKMLSVLSGRAGMPGDLETRAGSLSALAAEETAAAASGAVV